MKKIVYVGFAFPHHWKTHAGYNHIQDCLQYDYMIDDQKRFSSKIFNAYNLFYRIVRKMCRIIFCGKPYVPLYLLKVLYYSLFKRDVIFHVIYGENFIDKLFLACTLNNKIVCTLHQPFNWFEKEKSWFNHLKKINHIILMSSDEIKKYEKITGRRNVTYIPHGICTNFYHLPEPGYEKDGSILMVGNWLRDFKFANKAFCRILHKNPLQIINVVCSKEHWSEFTDSRINCLTGISDEELRELYWKASVLFLPLFQFTANNALLEASACGCNIIIASSQTENDYIPNEMLPILPLELNKCIDNIMKCINGQAFNEKLSQYVQEKYSWEIISERTKQVLLGR